MTDEQVKFIARKVILQTIRDINSKNEGISRAAINDVKSGRLDLFMWVCNINIPRKEFIELAKKRGKKIMMKEEMQNNELT